MILALAQDASWFPDQGSTMASRVDLLYGAWLAVAAFFAGGIALALILFSIRFRRSRSPRPATIEGSVQLEILWAGAPLLITMGFFVWGARIFVELKTIPDDGLEIDVTGKQWMWKLQHPTGQREINTLHVPLGRPVTLTMTSEDVIHSFYVPAFRVKQDVVPGRYTRTWFEAKQLGSFHLFCAEYCGAEHSNMIGRVVVLAPEDYQAWLAGQPAEATAQEAGEALFGKLRCDTCHTANAGQQGPLLEGRFGLPAPLEGGVSVTFDEDYVRESILEPNKRLSRGFQPLMPTYKGQVTEEEIFQLIAYLRSLAPQEQEPVPEDDGQPAPPAAQDDEPDAPDETRSDETTGGGER